jgi:hypothetical protein
MISLATIKLSRIALALSLAFWIAGLGCVFGCESFAMNGMGNDTQPAQDHGAHTQLHLLASGDACATREGHSCCTRHRAAAKQRPNPAVNPTRIFAPVLAMTHEMMGGSVDETIAECPLALNATALVTKVRADEAPLSIASRAPAAPLDIIERSTIPSASDFCNNRGHTHLLCCVFLI